MFMHGFADLAIYIDRDQSFSVNSLEITFIVCVSVVPLVLVLRKRQLKSYFARSTFRNHNFVSSKVILLYLKTFPHPFGSKEGT